MTDALTDAERLLRAVELMRVAADRVVLPKMPEDTTRYDDADCDGFCLADDLRAAADALEASAGRTDTEDTARLDWLEEHLSYMMVRSPGPEMTVLQGRGMGWKNGELRSAIDAARTPTPVEG